MCGLSRIIGRPHQSALCLNVPLAPSSEVMATKTAHLARKVSKPFQNRFIFDRSISEAEDGAGAERIVLVGNGGPRAERRFALVFARLAFVWAGRACGFR